MHIRRLSTFLLGAWLFGSGLMILIAAHNLSAVDRMVSAPPSSAAIHVEVLGDTAARAFLRFQASELNRWNMETWGWVQLGIGALFLLVLFFGGAHGRGVLLLAGMMFVAAGILQFAITPQVVKLGRQIDATPRVQRSVERQRFPKFQSAYVITEGLKDLFGLMLLSSFLRRHGTPIDPNAPRKYVRAR